MKRQLMKYAEFIVDNLLEGCQIINKQLEYVYLNKSALKQSKKSLQELIGKKITDCYPGIQDTPFFDVLLNSIENEVPNTMINRFIYPDHSEAVFRLKLTPTPEGVFIMSEDITESVKAEERITESNNRYTRLSNELDDMIIWTASIPDKRILDINGAFEKIYEYRIEEIKNNPDIWILTVHPDDKAVALRSNVELFEKGFAEAEYRIHTRSGKIKWINDKKSIIYNAAGERIEIGGIARDITQLKLSQQKIIESEAQYKYLFEHSPQPMFIYDVATFRFLAVNDTAVQKYGYSIDEFMSMTVLDIRPKEDIPLFLQAVSLTSDQFHEHKFRRHLLKGGNEIYVNVYSYGMEYKGKNTRFVLAIDVTDMKIAEEMMIEAKEKAEEMNRLKSNFLSNMSHELRTPLISINGYAELLKEELTIPELRDMAEGIYSGGVRLAETLNLILDLARLESGRFELIFKNIELVKEAHDIFESFKILFARKGIKFSFNNNAEKIFFRIDLRAFHSILNNLMSNALKYTHEGEVRLEINKYDTYIEIIVEDTGIGIPEEYYELIFEEFRQISEGNSRSFEGSGLGLSITKRMIDRLGGVISVESQVGKGSRFTVHLPIYAPELTERTVDKPGLKNNIKILLVDDDQNVHVLFKRYLKGIAELVTVEDSNKAIDAVNNDEFDLIIMDINLRSGLDGKEATKIIRRNKRYKNIPIIAVTSYASHGDELEFLAAGCSHYISKPFKREEIMNLIMNLLSR